jgi:recombination protein RecT
MSTSPLTHQSQAMTVSSPGDLLKYLNKSRAAIEMALPKHLNPDRMMRLALTCFSTTPALRKCTPQSILASVVVASQLGLEIGVAGQGYLIPYGTTATFVPGWQGLVSLLNNTGRATAWTGSVFEGDEFLFQLGSHPNIQHIPGDNYGDPDKLVWVYACGKVNGSETPVIEAWPISRVWKHRDRFNKVGQKHYSFAHPEMYARKVVLLQVLKYMPRSIELNNAIAAADAAELGKATTVDNGVIVEVGGEAERTDRFNEPAKPVIEQREPETKPATPSRSEPSAPDDGDLGPVESQAQPAEVSRTESAKPAAPPAAPAARHATMAMVQEIAERCNAAGISEEQLIGWARKKWMLNPAITNVLGILKSAPRRILQMVDNWPALEPEILASK